MSFSAFHSWSTLHFSHHSSLCFLHPFLSSLTSFSFPALVEYPTISSSHSFLPMPSFQDPSFSPINKGCAGVMVKFTYSTQCQEMTSPKPPLPTPTIITTPTPFSNPSATISNHHRGWIVNQKHTANPRSPSPTTAAPFKLPPSTLRSPLIPLE